MTGQKLIRKTHEDRHHEPFFIKALKGHSDNNLDIPTFLAQRLRKATHHFCTIFVF